MNNYSILIVDDDESTHDVLGEYLVLAGFKVFDARDGAAGLQMIAEVKPDLVLLDVNMPILDGFKTMELIAGNRELRNVPVIFVTSLDRYNLKIKGLELGAEDYIVKPFHRAELLARVKAALRRGERYRRNEQTMVGSLSDISLVELLQTLDIGRKTACIQLRELSGTFCIEGGMISFAGIGNFIGTEAVMRLFFLEQGTFSLSFDPPSIETPRHYLPIQSTLFETMAYIDELRVIVKSISPENSLIELRETCVPEIERFRNLFPFKLYDLIAMMDGDLKENTKKISLAVSENRLTVVQ